MRLGVISDTHGNYVRVVRAVEIFQDHAVDLVLHCGDIDSAAIVGLFNPWPAHFVLGNMDDPERLPAAIAEAGQTCHGLFGQLELVGKRIAFLHGHEDRRLREAIANGQWDLVCHGHSHQARQEKCGPTLVLNPGAVHRSANPSVALVDLPLLRVTPLSLRAG